MPPVRVLLIQTAPSDLVGSMAGYADLLEAALASADSAVRVTRMNLAATAPRSRWPSAIARRLQTLALIRNARRDLPRIDADLVHLTDGSQAHVLRWLPGGVPLVATAHDLIPLLQARARFAVPPPRKAARWLIDRSIDGLRRADRIVADSSSTSRDLIAEAGVAVARIAVVHPSLRPDFLAAVDAERDGGQVATQPVVLHVGNNAFYKNRAGVLRIFARLSQGRSTRLVLAGPAPDPSLVELMKNLGIEAHVEIVVNPTMQALVKLYRSASLLLFPSLYEGFGWPPLEAMACGCPVVCSNKASLPEVVGDAAHLGDPNDEDSMARACLDILDNPGTASHLRERGLARAASFTPERMGRQLLDVYRRLLPIG